MTSANQGTWSKTLRPGNAHYFPQRPVFLSGWQYIADGQCSRQHSAVPLPVLIFRLLLNSLVLQPCICCVSLCCCSGPVRRAVISRRSAGARSPRCSRRGCCSRWCAATPRTLYRTSSVPSTASTTPKIAWLFGEFRQIGLLGVIYQN